MLKIEKTEFDSIYHNSKIAGNDFTGFYALRNIDVFNDIMINDTAFTAVYQTAETFFNNDLDCPRDDLALSKAGGTHKLLIKINDLYESDFENVDYMTVFLADIKEIYSEIDSLEKLRQVYDAINDNLPLLSEFEDDAWETLEQLQKKQSDEQESCE